MTRPDSGTSLDLRTGTWRTLAGESSKNDDLGGKKSQVDIVKSASRVTLRSDMILRTDVTVDRIVARIDPDRATVSTASFPLVHDC